MEFKSGDKVIITKRYKGNYADVGMEGEFIKSEEDWDGDESSPTYGTMITFYQLKIGTQKTWCVGIKPKGVHDWNGEGIKFRFV
ncbi:MAG: hypothetical protein ACK5OW_01595 [bacterium]|jgi:hypothetical protein